MSLPAPTQPAAVQLGVGLSHISPIQHPRLEALRASAKWAGSEHFSVQQADEHERWLEFLEAAGQLGRFSPRLCGKREKRDEALAEVATAYFLSERCALPPRTWEPRGETGTYDFTVELPDRRELFVEVKSPGWDAEIMQGQRAAGRSTPTPAAKRRMQGDKYIHLEVGPFDTTGIIRQVVTKNAYPKLLASTPNLVVLVDDFKVSLLDCAHQVLQALYSRAVLGATGWREEDGVFRDARLSRLGALGVLDVRYVPYPEYRFALFANPHVNPSTAVPPGPFSGYQIVPDPHW